MYSIDIHRCTEPHRAEGSPGLTSRSQASRNWAPSRAQGRTLAPIRTMDASAENERVRVISAIAERAFPPAGNDSQAPSRTTRAIPNSMPRSARTSARAKLSISTALAPCSSASLRFARAFETTSDTETRGPRCTGRPARRAQASSESARGGTRHCPEAFETRSAIKRDPAGSPSAREPAKPPRTAAANGHAGRSLAQLRALWSPTPVLTLTRVLEVGGSVCRTLPSRTAQPGTRTRAASDGRA